MIWIFRSSRNFFRRHFKLRRLNYAWKFCVPFFWDFYTLLSRPEPFAFLSNDTYRVHRYFTATLLTARDINDEIFHLIQPCDVLLIAFHLDFHIDRSENYYANTECREQPVARTQKYCREYCRYHSYALFRVPLLSRTLSAVGKLENGKI